MAVQVQQPQRRRRDLIDLVLGGLQAASAFTNIQKAQAELEAIPEAQARTARAEEQRFAATFQAAPEGAPGAVRLETPAGERGLFLPRAQVMAGQQQAAAAKAEALKTAQDTKTQKQDFETKLRNEWLKNPQTKVTQDVSAAVGKVRAAGTGEPSAAGDLSLIFNYMKLLDPGSVVREGEFATAQNAAGIPDRVKNFYNQVISGERLNPNQRRDFVNRAEQLYDVHIERQKAFNEEFEDLAKRSEVNPRNVVLDLKFEAPRKRRGLIPGQRFQEDVEVLNQNLQGIDQVQPDGQGDLETDLEEFRRLRGL